MTPTTLVLTNLLDALAETKSADQGLRQIDTFRRLLVGAGIFSVQLNVTTVDDPKNESIFRKWIKEAKERVSYQRQ